MKIIIEYFNTMQNMPKEEKEEWIGLCILLHTKINDLTLGEKYTLKKMLIDVWDEVHNPNVFGTHIKVLVERGAFPLLIPNRYPNGANHLIYTKI